VFDRGCCVIGADTAFVVAENHIKDPVKAVLDHSMGSDGQSDLVGNPEQRSDVEARLALDFIGFRAWSGYFARAPDHDDAFQSRPLVTFLQPSYIVVDHRIISD
jgi:hypothetical protein